MDERKEHTAVSIPLRATKQVKNRISPDPATPFATIDFDGPGFAEIEYGIRAYGSAKEETGQRFFTSVPATEWIGQRTVDPIRQTFNEMRGLATNDLFTRHVAAIFYKQAKFMEGFTDDYEEGVPFFTYYPYYQHMGYDQLRTYFTWRTKVRSGEIRRTSLSYVFLYIYELISNVGVVSPEDGLEKLMAIWDAYRVYEPTLNNYLPQWLKDYHVYYEMPHGFMDFIGDYDLQDYYPECCQDDAENSLALWNRSSSYDVTKSKFYLAGNETLLSDCFVKALHAVQESCKNTCLENVFVFNSVMRPWRPFQRALSYCPYKQRDRRVEMPGGEIYICKDNNWKSNAANRIKKEKGLVGYLIKKMEACLRQAMKYQYGIKANPDMALLSLYHIPSYRVKEFENVIATLDGAIEKAVKDYYAELTRTVVTVDHSNLARIRQEALGTQEKLIVPEVETRTPSITTPPEPLMVRETVTDEPPSVCDDWSNLKSVLSATEIKALSLVLRNDGDIKGFGDEHGIMLEVLVDGINEKAADAIGDCILELNDGITIYEEYKTKIAEMVG